MRAPVLRTFDAFPGELVIDNFAGGGGATVGIEAALGRPVDMAFNHSKIAIAMHAANHPETRHFCQDIREVDPLEVCGGRPVGLAWFSPDCTHFSRAKGKQPVKKEIRALAWVVIDWARKVRPRVILLENVEEFQTWGPLLEDEPRPDPLRAGETFRAWLAALKACGYEVEFRSLVAADYGTPTSRRRLFLIARRDGAPVVWPATSHGEGRGESWRPASEVIDWSIPCPSIFTRARPLAPATMARIASGVRRFVLESADPFVAQTNGKRLVAPIITKHYGGVVGHRVDRILGTVTTKDHHALTTAFLLKYYGANGSARSGQPVAEPLHTVTTKARFGLVTVRGADYQIADIGMRMLQPRELFAAQGFPAGYEIAPTLNGKTITKTDQTSLAGNSVCCQVAEALVRANARAA